jgi:cytochrome c oxidase cbb3-type subunit III
MLRSVMFVSSIEKEETMKRFRIRNVLGVAVLLSGMCIPSAFAGPGDPVAGKVTYEKTCAMCHGTAGKGDGPTAAVLNPKPRNHTDGQYMNALKDDYLFKIIKEGGPAVGKAPLMPGWAAQIKDDDIHNVIAYIRTLAVPPYKAAAAPAASAPAPKAAAAVVEKKTQ